MGYSFLITYLQVCNERRGMIRIWIWTSNSNVEIWGVGLTISWTPRRKWHAFHGTFRIWKLWERMFRREAWQTVHRTVLQCSEHAYWTSRRMLAVPMKNVLLLSIADERCFLPRSDQLRTHAHCFQSTQLTSYSWLVFDFCQGVNLSLCSLTSITYSLPTIYNFRIHFDEPTTKHIFT